MWPVSGSSQFQGSQQLSMSLQSFERCGGTGDCRADAAMDRAKLGRVGWQEHQTQVFGHAHRTGGMPAGLVHEPASLSAAARQKTVHRSGIEPSHHQRYAGVAAGHRAPIIHADRKPTWRSPRGSELRISNRSGSAFAMQPRSSAQQSPFFEGLESLFIGWRVARSGLALR
jgi:hypothetical protein